MTLGECDTWWEWFLVVLWLAMVIFFVLWFRACLLIAEGKA